MVSAEVMPGGNGRMRPGVLARFAGAFYLLAVAAAVTEEFLIPGRLGRAGFAMPVACYATVMFLLYSLLRPLNRTLPLLAVVSGLAGLALEPLRWHPGGVNVAMVLHGVYCLQMGFLLARTRVSPILAGAAMMAAGVVWLGYISISFAQAIAPWNTALGLIGESLPMLWLLVMGASGTQRSEQAEVVQ